MWKFIKYSFNKAFEKDLLYLIIFFLFLSFIGVTVISTLIFVLQEFGVLSENNFYTETLWQGFRLFFDQNAIFTLGDRNTFLDYFFKFNITIFGILIFSSVIGIADKLKGQLPIGLIALKSGVQKNNETISKECIQMVRDKVGPVAAFKTAIVVKRLPKTRSGKILRGTVRKIADKEEYKMPATIDDPAILDEIKQDLIQNNILK